MINLNRSRNYQIITTRQVLFEHGPVNVIQQCKVTLIQYQFFNLVKIFFLHKTVPNDLVGKRQINYTTFSIPDSIISLRQLVYHILKDVIKISYQLFYIIRIETRNIPHLLLQQCRQKFIIDQGRKSTSVKHYLLFNVIKNLVSSPIDYPSKYMKQLIRNNFQLFVHNVFLFNQVIKI